MRLFHIGRRAADGSLAPPLPRSVAGRATKCLREMALVGEMLDTIFAIAPMMEWTDRAEEQSIIST
jgi:hypothetical protein